MIEPQQQEISTVARSGGLSLRQTTATANTGSYQDITGLIPGRAYQFVAWVRAESGEVSARIKVSDTTGANMVSDSGTAGDSMWWAVYTTFTATAEGVARVRLEMPTTTGALLWDDVEVMPTYDSCGKAVKLKYYPYGQEVGTVTANDRVKFGTYTRDAATGLDYAMNRYYQSTWGRFTSPDPYRASGGPGDPGSWNRYAYVQGDPVNYGDPSGLQRAGPWTIYNIFGPEGWYTLMIPNWGYDPAAFEHGEPGGIRERAGVTRAKEAMAGVANGDFKNKPDCMKLLTELAKQSGGDVDSLIHNIRDVASNADEYIYDGPSSNTQMTSDKFPGAGGGTVGQWFRTFSGRQALSQYNGYAVFVNSNLWDGFLSPFYSGGSPSALGMGTMMHEVLHKNVFGFNPLDNNHLWFLNAMDSAGLSIRPGNANYISSVLGMLCF